MIGYIRLAVSVTINPFTEHCLNFQILSNKRRQTDLELSSMPSPPVVDFSNFLSGDPEHMEQCAGEIGQACRTQGFFQIANHPIPLSL